MADNSAMNTLKSLLGDDAEQKIQAVMSSLSSSSENNDSSNEELIPTQNTAPPTPIDTAGLEQILKIKEIINELGNSRSDSRSNLLMSLKPFLRQSRQQSVDSAVRLLNLTKLSNLIKR